MPLQATFVADFSKWDKALADAQKGLKTFEVAGKGVQRQLENMSKSLSGVNIKKDADIAVAGIKSIGGATALTQKEAQRLNAVLSESIAKYKAMGQQVPAELRKIQAETAKVAKETGFLGGAVAKAGTLLAGAFTVGAIVSLSRKVLQLGSDLSDLSAKTGIGVEALQEFQFAGSKVGVSLDDITTGINQMQNRIAEGDKSAVGALKRLNISFSDFKKLKPEDQFAAVAEAVGGIEDPAEKVRTAMDLMGKSGAAVLPLLTTGFDEAREAARRLGIVLDEQTIKSLDDMGETVEALQAVHLAGFARLLVELEPLLTSMASAVLNSAKALAYLQDQFELVLVGAGDLQAEFAEMEVSLYKLAEALNPAAKWMGTFTDSIADAQQRAAEARTWVKAMADGITRDATKAIIALAKLQEVRSKPVKLGAGGANAPSDEEIKRFQKWRAEVTGAATEKALKQLTDDWNALTKAEKESQPTREAVTAQYEKLRVSLPRVGGALEDLRNSTLKVLQPMALLQQQLASIGATAMPDAVGMFNAGQAALAGLTREGNLASRQLVTLEQAMNAVPAELFTKNVRKMAGETLKFADILEHNLTEALGNVANIITDALIHGASFEQTAAAIGTQIGSAIGKSIGQHLGGPVGGAIGEALGSLLGPLIEKLIVTRAEKTVKRVAYEFGVSISEELAQGIEDEAERLFGGNRQASKIFHLDEILAEGGGLSADNIGPMFDRFRDLFSMLETGAFSAAQAVEVLDKNFKTFADFVTEGGSLASKELLEIIKLTEETGLRSAEVSAFVVQQLQGALGGLTTFLDNVNVTTQAAAEGISASLFGIFEGMTENGVSAADAIKQIAPLIEKLDKQLKAAGLSGGAAFAEIQALAAVAGHEIAGPLITGVLGLEQAMAGLHNSGVLTEEMFDGLTASVADTFAQILATGVDGAKALQLIAPSLQTAWELSEDFGYSLDEATQKLIDEAKAAGLVGDEHRTATEQMLKLTERMTDAVEFLAKAFGYVTDEVDDLGDAIESLPDIPSGPSSEGFEPSTGYVPMARGGMVPKYLAGGGASGTDTVPAWLTPGEFVMRRDAVDRIGANNLEAMNSGGVSGTTNVYVTIQAWDGSDVKRVVQSREFADAFVEGQARNTHTIRTRTKAALQ